MAKMYFYYGAMGASKTAQALMAAYNYEQQGQRVLLVKADLDTRDGATKIRSRVGLEHECKLLSEVCSKPLASFEKEKINAILVDEVQFAKPAEIDFLSDIADYCDIPVVCYGLRADFRGEFFPGSKRLFEIADKIQEIKVTCWCGKKATMNARYNEIGIVKEGEQVMLGSNDSYVGLCRLHWKLGMLQGGIKKNETDNREDD